jgi:soluble lytic murein transglycosylase-like protein
MIKFRHFFYTTFLIISMIVIASGFKSEKTLAASNRSLDDAEYHMSVHYPACLRMYYSIEKYSDKYGIPKQYAYGIAYNETKYKSPFQWEYNSKQVSSTGALGPMQILLSTAKWIWHDNNITRNKMLTDVDFNVETSMKYISILYKRYGNWKLVFGYYNTGQPTVNNYAISVVKHKN